MLGINYAKFDSMTYVIHYVNGKIEKEGRGLSFFYMSHNSSIAAIPLGSNDLPFIFNETTADYQVVTIQGQLTYRIKDPKKLAEMLDFTLDHKGNYKKEDQEKLKQRLINEAHTSTTDIVQSFSLKEVLRSAKLLEERIKSGLSSSNQVETLGIEALAVNILAVRASPEMARALEAATREGLQQEADKAIYDRRNFAVEQEKIIRESELNTEIAVEQKRKEIGEKQMEREVMEEENQRKLREMKITADVSVEEKRKTLVELQAENEKKLGEAKRSQLEAVLEPYRDVDWKKIMALNANGNDPQLNLAIGIRELSENAGKIGMLNLSPDLLQTILNK